MDERGTPGAQPEAAERPMRELGKRVGGTGRRMYVAGALALTEPGPAAAGIVVTDGHDRVLAQRSHYLGSMTRSEATARALLTAARLAQISGLREPIFCIDDARVAEALTRGQPLPEGPGYLTQDLRAALDQLPGHRLEVIPTTTNLARSVALAPLVEWLPERTRRSEALEVRPLGDHVYEVASESQPGQTYHVTLRPPDAPGDGDPINCECADFQHRRIPCKHLLAVAREAGGLNQLFYGDRRPGTVPAGSE